MLSLAVQLLSIVAVSSIISYIGQSTISTFLYSLSTYVAPSPTLARSKTLKAEIVRNRKELRDTSSQDEFAKWAKIRRTLDKNTADLDKLNTAIQAQSSTFASVVKVVVFIATTGLQFLITTRHSRTPIVWLPPQWFGPASWFLSLPMAPSGAVSCGVFVFFVRRAGGVVVSAVKELLTPVEEKIPVPVTETPVAPEAEKKSQ